MPLASCKTKPWISPLQRGKALALADRPADDAGEIAVGVAGDGGVDSHGEPDHLDLLAIREVVDPVLVDQRLSPERVRVVVEELATDLLPPDARPLVAAHDRAEERRRQVVGIVVGRPLGDHHVRLVDQLADDQHVPRSGGDDTARLLAEPKPEHELVPRRRPPDSHDVRRSVLVTDTDRPRSELVSPEGVVLGTAEASRLLSGVASRDRAVRPDDAALGRVVDRAAVLREVSVEREDPAFAFHHDVANVASRAADQGHAPGSALLDLAADPLGPAACLAETSTGEDQPDRPVAWRSDLLGAGDQLPPAPDRRHLSAVGIRPSSRAQLLTKAAAEPGSPGASPSEVAAALMAATSALSLTAL